ncbi:hypothetical protein [Streptomyces sp. AB3(2024)]|uniref:DUF7224 domain-containing protein n=1 Tax=Streptomyces sp. AB3(2024) TaxID=3317321 RepID=UPI0035A35FFF
MIKTANLRSSAAPWLVLPALFYAGVVVQANAVTAGTDFGVLSGEYAGQSLPIVTAAVAASAAWEAGRQRALTEFVKSSVRSPLQRVLYALLPTVALHVVLVTTMVALGWQLQGVPPSGAGWLAVAHLVVIPLGWMAIGWAIGTVAPRSIAAPLAGILGWILLLFPASLATPWYRHLFGTIIENSTVTDVRAPAAYLIPWAFTTVMALAVWIAITLKPRVAGVLVGLAVLAASLVVGRGAVIDWGYVRPDEPRALQYTCAGASPKVCFPVEYADYVGKASDDIRPPLAALARAGIALPDELRLQSARVPVTPGIWPYEWYLPRRGTVVTRGDTVSDLAETVLAGTARDQGVAKPCNMPGSAASAWAMLVMGADTTQMRQMVPPEMSAELDAVRKRSVGDQADWFRAQARSQKHCQAPQ